MNALTAYCKVREKTQETIIKTHIHLVKRIAYHLMQRLPSSIQLDDLMQSGLVGLLEALRHYDDSKGASFETYASIRIRGYMIDEVRRNGWVPRSVYKNARVIAEAVKTVENRLGREPKDSEIAKELQLNLDEYFDLQQDSTSNQLFGFDDLGVTDDELTSDNGSITEPQQQVVQDNLLEYLNELIDDLPKNERLVLILHYERDLNLKEIGEVLSVSESRVSQIHSQATLKIRSKMGSIS